MNRRQLKQLLKQHNWIYKRHGKGSHQIWTNEITGALLSVPGLASSGDYTRDTARALSTVIRSMGR